MSEVSKVLYTIYIHSMLLMPKVSKVWNTILRIKDQKIKSYVKGVESGVWGTIFHTFNTFNISNITLYWGDLYTLLTPSTYLWSFVHTEKCSTIFHTFDTSDMSNITLYWGALYRVEFTFNTFNIHSITTLIVYIECQKKFKMVLHIFAHQVIWFLN